jgi:hypothetical protein
VAERYNLDLIISEWGFANNQVPEGETKRIEMIETVMSVMDAMPRIKAATLFWSQDTGPNGYYISPAGLASIRVGQRVDAAQKLLGMVQDKWQYRMIPGLY